jgi:hypothetical protein
MVAMDPNPYESPQGPSSPQPRPKRWLDNDDPFLTIFFVICLSALLLFGCLSVVLP